MASYARPADDQAMRQMADRTQVRAILLGGELLKQIEPGKTGPKLQDCAAPRLTRAQAATDTGLTLRQFGLRIPADRIQRAQCNRPRDQCQPRSLLRRGQPQEVRVAHARLPFLVGG